MLIPYAAGATVTLANLQIVGGAPGASGKTKGADGAGSREFLFAKYGLGTQDIVNAAWDGLKVNRPPPQALVVEANPGAYAPV